MSFFTEKYYQELMQQYKYSDVAKINFPLGQMSTNRVASRWLCHYNGIEFSENLYGKKSIITTGLGMSGVPHMGTLMQILNAKYLAEAGVTVQLVLGDLDAYNGKNISLDQVNKYAQQYSRFISKIVKSDNLIVRKQMNASSVLKTMYISGNNMLDEDFDETEEDLHAFYVEKGKVDSHMSFRRKLSLALMVADFIDLAYTDNYENIMVILGVDEHKYVRFAEKVFNTTLSQAGIRANFSAMYSPLLTGFNGYPKMSKSFPESSINLISPLEDISQKIMLSKGDNKRPHENVVFQLIHLIGNLSELEMEELVEDYLIDGIAWEARKKSLVDEIVQYTYIWADCGL